MLLKILAISLDFADIFGHLYIYVNSWMEDGVSTPQPIKKNYGANLFVLRISTEGWFRAKYGYLFVVVVERWPIWCSA